MTLTRLDKIVLAERIIEGIEDERDRNKSADAGQRTAAGLHRRQVERIVQELNAAFK